MKFELASDHCVTMRTVMFKITDHVVVSGFTATHVRITLRDGSISEFMVQGRVANETGDFTYRHMPLHDVFGTEWQTFIDNVPAKESAPSS